MRNSLQTLERIKKFELDEQQRILSAALDREQETNGRLKKLIEDYEAEKAFVLQNPGICDFGAYTKQYLKKKHALEKQLDEIRAEIDSIRDKMADIFKEQKTYNLIDANRQKAEQKEIDAKEQKALDEIGTNAYIKKHQE